MSPDLVDWIWRAAIGLVIALVLYAVKDWRKVRLENELAEGQQEPKVKKAGIEALESQILAMSKAWEEERASMNRRIEELLARLAECDQIVEDKKAQLAAAEATIAEMRRQASEMQAKLATFQEQLERLTTFIEPDKEKNQ